MIKDNVFTFVPNENQNSIPSDEEKTVKKQQFDDMRSHSSFDEEEEMPDAKDFEEFDRVE